MIPVVEENTPARPILFLKLSFVYIEARSAVDDVVAVADFVCCTSTHDSVFEHGFAKNRPMLGGYGEPDLWKEL